MGHDEGFQIYCMSGMEKVSRSLFFPQGETESDTETLETNGTFLGINSFHSHLQNLYKKVSTAWFHPTLLSCTFSK